MSKTPTSHGLEDATQYATKHKAVQLFVRSVLRRLLPADLWSSSDALSLIMIYVDRFLDCRKFESPTLQTALEGIEVSYSFFISMTRKLKGFQISRIAWLAPTNSSSEHKMSQSDFSKRKEIFAEFLYWLLDSFVIPLIRTNFQVTGSNNDKNRLFFFRQDVWKRITEPTIAELKTSMFSEMRPEAVKKMLASRSLGYSQIRLLPKATGFRPIMNLKKRPEHIQYGRRLLGRSINSQLTPAFKVLNYELVSLCNLLGILIVSNLARAVVPTVWAARYSLSVAFIPPWSLIAPDSTTAISPLNPCILPR
jgi:telomerase reverse transcriptase